MLGFIFTLIYALFILSGLVIGLIRGWKRSLIRLAWLIGSIILLFIVTGFVTPALLDVDISFLNLSIDGTSVSTIKQYATVIASQAIGSTPESLYGAVDFIVALTSLFLNSFVFVILFFALKAITFVLFKIFNLIFIHDKGKKKGRLLGGLIGGVSGLLVALTILMPVAGYISLYGDVKKAFADDPEFSDSFAQSDEVIACYDNDPTVKIMRTIGLESFQVIIFDNVSASKYEDVTFRLTEEKNAFLKALPDIIELSRQKSEDGSVKDYAVVTDCISALIDSNLLYKGVTKLAPVIREKIESQDEPEDDTEKIVREALLNVLENVSAISKKDLKEGLTVISETIPLIQNADDDVKNLDFALIGNKVDRLIGCGIIGGKKVAELAAFGAEKAFGDLKEDDSLYPTAQQIINGFKNGVNSYETELGALGHIVKITDYLSEDPGKDDLEQHGEEIGECLDDAIACNAQIINKSLIDTFIVSLIDDAVVDSLKDTPFEDCVDTIKDNVRLRYSYREEFGYLAKLINVSEKLGSDFSLEAINEPYSDGKTLGQKLDEIKPSVIVGELPVKVISKTVEDYGNENPDFKSAADEIIERLKYGVISYEAEFNAIAPLYDAANLVSDANFDIKTDGEKVGEYLDSALAIRDARVINKSVIDRFIVSFIDSTVSGKLEGTTVEDQIPTIKNNVGKSYSYKTEFGYVSKLIKITDSVELSVDSLDKEIDGKPLGKCLDEITPSVLIGELPLKIVGKAVENYGNENPDFKSAADLVSENLKSGVTSYEVEFQALKPVIDAAKISSGSLFDITTDGEKIGERLDMALSFKNAELINKQVIDEFILSFIDNTVADRLNGTPFSNQTEEIKANVVKDYSYKTEFAYVSKLIKIADSGNDFSIARINAKNIEGKTLGERLDEIAPSVLVGEIPLNVIEHSLNDYANDGNNAKYTIITSEVKKNFATIRNQTAVAGKSGIYTYSYITDQFSEIYDAITDVSTRITEKTTFGATDAAEYEETLEKLQDNALMAQNGTRALALYVTEEVETILGAKQIYRNGQFVTLDEIRNDPEFDLFDKIDIYKDYLKTTDGDEPYNSDSLVYGKITGEKVYYASDETTRVNKPFTYFYELAKPYII